MLKNYEVAVMFGGVSGENEVSVITGTMVCNVLLKGGKSVLPVYIDRKGDMYAGENLATVTNYKGGNLPQSFPCSMASGGFVLFNKKGKFKGVVKTECIINCCHGGVYEGGAVAGTAELNKIPFASANMFESSAFMDKYYTKLVLQSLGVKTAKYVYFRDSKGAIEGAKELGYPLIVKPATLGSSIGIAKADNEEELKEALAVAFELDSAVLLEEYLSPKKEINCSAYYSGDGVVISPLEEVRSSGAILSYDDKYSGGGERIFPAQLQEDTSEEIKKITKRVYSTLAMRGIVRFDFIVCMGEVYLSEVNTVPGSLSQYLLSTSYRDFYKVLCQVIDCAKREFLLNANKKVITTGILNNIVVSNACKIK
ncbi:MAG: ATP-grasp domain-containing protein [Candidatus Coproplasma sp.]